MGNHRLLVIEDEKKIADLVCRIANEINFDVRTTCDYAEIPFLYDEFSPQAIVLDIVMPGMDGFEMLNFLHKRGSSAHIVILSGEVNYRAMVSRMAEGLDLGITATIAKPFHIAELRHVLEKIKLTLPQSDGSSSAGTAAYGQI